MTASEKLVCQRTKNHDAVFVPSPIKPLVEYAPGKARVCKNAKRPANTYPLASTRRARFGMIEYWTNNSADVIKSTTHITVWSTGTKTFTWGSWVFANGATESEPTSRKMITASAALR